MVVKRKGVEHSCEVSSDALCVQLPIVLSIMTFLELQKVESSWNKDPSQMEDLQGMQVGPYRESER